MSSTGFQLGRRLFATNFKWLYANIFPVFKFFFAHIICLSFFSLSSASAKDGATLQLSGATGGIIRSPNTNQPVDRGNGFSEAWIKGNLEIYRHGDTSLKLFILGNYVRDTNSFAYNNTQKSRVGLSLSTRFGQYLEVTASATYGKYREIYTTTRRRGAEYTIEYYYYRYFPEKSAVNVLGMPKRASALKSYGSLKTPGSLIKGDHNVVLTIGGDYSAMYDVSDSKWLFSPFVAVDFSWDADRNDYNNKFVPAIGGMMKRPIDKGEIFLGVKFEVDYRWINETINAGPMIFAGWYKGF